MTIFIFGWTIPLNSSSTQLLNFFYEFFILCGILFHLILKLPIYYNCMEKSKHVLQNVLFVFHRRKKKSHILGLEWHEGHVNDNRIVQKQSRTNTDDREHLLFCVTE